MGHAEQARPAGAFHGARGLGVHGREGVPRLGRRHHGDGRALPEIGAESAWAPQRPGKVVAAALLDQVAHVANRLIVQHEPACRRVQHQTQCRQRSSAGDLDALAARTDGVAVHGGFIDRRFVRPEATIGRSERRTGRAPSSSR